MNKLKISQETLTKLCISFVLHLHLVTFTSFKTPLLTFPYSVEENSHIRDWMFRHSAMNGWNYWIIFFRKWPRLGMTVRRLINITLLIVSRIRQTMPVILGLISARYEIFHLAMKLSKLLKIDHFCLPIGELISFLIYSLHFLRNAAEWKMLH